MPDYTHSDHSDQPAGDVSEALVAAISQGTVVIKRELVDVARHFDLDVVPSDITILVSTVDRAGTASSWRSSWHGLKQADDEHPTEFDQVAEIFRHLDVASRRIGLRLDLRRAGEQLRRAQRRTPGRRRGPQDHR